MHRFHSSMIPWQIYCPAVANTLKVFKSRKVASPSDVSQSYPIWAISDILIPSRYAAILHFYSFIFQDNEQSCACNKISLALPASDSFIKMIRENTLGGRLCSHKCEHKVLKLSGLTFNYYWTHLCTLRNLESFGNCQAQVLIGSPKQNPPTLSQNSVYQREGLGPRLTNIRHRFSYFPFYPTSR